MENLEILKDELTPETYSALEKETKDSKIKLADISKGDYVSLAKYNALDEQLKSTQSLLNSKNDEYEELKKTAGDNEDLKNQIDTMKKAFDKEKADIQKDANEKLKKARVTAQIVSEYHPKDVSDVLTHINLDKISVDDDKLIGLKEQVDPIKEQKAYLFEDEAKKGASGLQHGDDGEDYSFIRKAFGLKDKKE